MPGRHDYSHFPEEMKQPAHGTGEWQSLSYDRGQHGLESHSQSKFGYFQLSQKEKGSNIWFLNSEGQEGKNANYQENFLRVFIRQIIFHKGCRNF